MAEKILHLELTETEAYNLANFVEENLIDVIRVDTDIDSIVWLCNMTNIYKKLKETGVEVDD